MAKEKGKFSFKDLTKVSDGVIKKLSIVRETEKTSNARGTISTGIYVLNAAISSDIYGGIPDNRISVFAGSSGVGKSFLCYSIVKQAQLAGYSVIYIDTEYAIELDQLPGYGIDIDEDKFMLIRSNIIEDLKIYTTQLLDNLKDQKDAGNELDKIMIVIDSVGQLGSRKEVEDALSGKEKADFTKAKALASYFRIINSDLGLLKIPLICTNHTYSGMEMFPQEHMKGGCLIGGISIQTRDGLKMIEDIVKGDYVLTLDGYEEVLETHIFEKETIEFELEDGQIIKCSKNHKFLINENFHDENSWKTAEELNEDDIILKLNNDTLFSLTVLKKRELNYTQKVYDLTVANSHHYVDENGLIHHNSGLFYSASTIAFLSKAKLKEGEMDDLDLGQSGLLVTAKMVKNRMAKPKKVKFEISFTSGCNPYVGLDYWCTGENFEQVGVAKGKMVDDKFVPGGNRWYVRHLGTHVKGSDLLTGNVFNKEVLDSLRPIIKEYFRYKSITEIEDIEKRLLEAKGQIDLDEDDDYLNASSLDSSNLFDEDED